MEIARLMLFPEAGNPEGEKLPPAPGALVATRHFYCPGLIRGRMVCSETDRPLAVERSVLLLTQTRYSTSANALA